MAKRRIQQLVAELAEEKYRDTTQSVINTSLFYTNGFTNITAVPQGAEDIQRIGNKILIHEIEYRIMITPQILVGGFINFSRLRLLIFKWYDDQVPSWQDILQNATGPFDQKVLSPYTHDKELKRTILVDTAISAQQTISGALTCYTVNNYPAVFEGIVDLRRSTKKLREVNYIGGTTTGVGNIYMGVIGADIDQIFNVWNNTGTLCSYCCKIKFTDV